MAASAVFVNSALLDQWVTSGGADVELGSLTVRSTGERLGATEAVHVQVEVTGAGDSHGWEGRVYPAAQLVALGAELLERSLVVGDLAYDVDPGFLLQPLGPAEPQELLISRLAALSTGPQPSPQEAQQDAQSDEVLLARYLMKRL